MSAIVWAIAKTGTAIIAAATRVVVLNFIISVFLSEWLIFKSLRWLSPCMMRKSGFASCGAKAVRHYAENKTSIARGLAQKGGKCCVGQKPPSGFYRQ